MKKNHEKLKLTLEKHKQNAHTFPVSTQFPAGATRVQVKDKNKLRQTVSSSLNIHVSKEFLDWRVCIFLGDNFHNKLHPSVLEVNTKLLQHSVLKQVSQKLGYRLHSTPHLVPYKQLTFNKYLLTK